MWDMANALKYYEDNIDLISLRKTTIHINPIINFQIFQACKFIGKQKRLMGIQGLKRRRWEEKVKIRLRLL